MKYTLLMVELSGIQDYIFGSNNLRVNVGASSLVNRAIYEWLPGLLPRPNNVGPGGECQEAAIEASDPMYACEAVYMGGGNAFLIFRMHDEADKFIRQFTRLLLKNAPGLNVVIESLDMDWEQDSLVLAQKTLRQHLARRKLHPLPGQALPGLGVSAACVFTGLPASRVWVDPGGDRKLISAEVGARLDEFAHGQQTLRELFPEVEKAGYEFVTEFNDFGTHHESSYIAIVYADGNRMGERIEKLGQPFVTSMNGNYSTANRGFANGLRKFSDSSSRAAMRALKACTHKLLESRQQDEEGEFWQRRKGMRPEDRQRLPKVRRNSSSSGQLLLPIRPLLFGGDDVALVTDGRLGLALAQEYLEVYGETDLADGEKAVGRAGVAIVNTHFPFAQGYALAVDLNENAKEVGEDGKKASLDWHFGVNGVVRSLAEIRQSSYTVRSGKLSMRPICLDKGTDWRNWEIFTDLVQSFQLDKAWRGRRNKVKALRGALRNGPASTKAFLENYRLESLPGVSGYANLGMEGWQGNYCAYFDPLEAIDFFIPLEVEE